MKTVILVYIATISTAGGVVDRRWEMQDMPTCIAAAQAAKVQVPQGGDAETTVSLFCVGGDGARVPVVKK